MPLLQHGTRPTRPRHGCDARLLRIKTLGRRPWWPCAPSRAWRRLSEAADRVWSTMQEADWLEAFACHPRIGERKARRTRRRNRSAWSRAGTIVSRKRERKRAGRARRRKSALRTALRLHLHRVRHGQKRRRDAGDSQAPAGQRSREAELREAAEQQRQIMQIRLGKWLIE